MNDGQESPWDEGLEAVPSGFASKPGNVPPFQRVWVSEEEAFCRHCEYPIHAGEPFTIGANGKYCRFCLEREGWRVVPASPPVMDDRMRREFFRRLYEGSDFGPDEGGHRGGL